VKGLLDELRALAPQRPLTEREAYGIAERQALRLLKLSDITSGPVPSEIVAGLPYVKVHVRRLANSSGGSKWIKPRWLIVLNSFEPSVRQRFSLFHEFKHVIDHPRMRSGLLRPDTPTKYLGNERLCDYFAACVLMPRPWIKAAWTAGLQDPVALATRFEVSPQAMQVRLLQLGLVEAYRRHGEIDNVYFRSQPASLLGQAA
jgi:Zn-dependent peptidase ImmA (M78 family)